MLGVAAEGVLPHLDFLGGEKPLPALLSKQADIGVIVTRLKTKAALKQQAAERPHAPILRPAAKQHAGVELLNTVAPHRVAAEKGKIREHAQPVAAEVELHGPTLLRAWGGRVDQIHVFPVGAPALARVERTEAVQPAAVDLPERDLARGVPIAGIQRGPQTQLGGRVGPEGKLAEEIILDEILTVPGRPIGEVDFVGDQALHRTEARRQDADITHGVE